MGGLGTSSSETKQQSSTQPWIPAQPTLYGMLGQLNNYLPQTGITPAQTNALNTIENNANTVSANYTPAVNNVTASLLAGGGALSQAPAVQSAFNTFNAQTNPLASNTNYDPLQTPGIGDALDKVREDATQAVNGQFAAGGRTGSGYNQKTLAQAITQAEAPIVTNQFNANRTAQQGAAGNLYAAATGNAGILSGLQQQFLANQQQGVNGVNSVLDTSNAGANAQLMAEAQRLGIPLQNLGMLANIGIPIAGLGSQSQGTSNTTSTMSPIGMITGLLGAMYGRR